MEYLVIRHFPQLIDQSVYLCTYLDIKLLAISYMCMVLQRGVFFEIMYGRALFDARDRKDLFANAQVNHSFRIWAIF